ncbi:hypothetical protein ULMS_23160 [Patiriisocius marinistellae]|uniref:Glycosyl transferase family 1 domain-containing protein n=1 Tax=Patiriisocius marinistellae TaxID=2494560 RepID=A0A5J4FZF6_9FLAO|nr:glycosyltransferase [Patiriisocius marinistellae]GEQ86808.1 hypothetical protein ULMS_23160 [Patiriisocius marinistellae]
MKILIVAIPTIHTYRWCAQLEGEGHELFFFNILHRKIPDYFKGFTIINDWEKNKLGKWATSKSLPRVIRYANKNFNFSFEENFHLILKKINPDIVHSFNMNISYPLIPYMIKHPNIPWMCNTWGSDIYYYQNFDIAKQKVDAMLGRLDFLFTDAKRDFELALAKGFKGKYLGTFPGGGGYNIPEKIMAVKERNTIIIKGYEHKFGRALNILKAIKKCDEVTKKYKLYIFSAHQSVVDFAETLRKEGFEIVINSTQKKIPHQEILNVMKNSIMYIGNNISDGIPNTLLEAIISGAFPIQSNPGGATAEILIHGKNGFLIENPEDINEITKHITTALQNKEFLENVQQFNHDIVAPTLAYELIKEKVVEKYKYLESKICN